MSQESLCHSYSLEWIIGYAFGLLALSASVALTCSSFTSQTLPQVCNLGEGNVFTSSLKQLYVAVTQQQARVACKRQREASGDSESAKHANTQDLPDEPEPEKGKAEMQSAAAQCTQDTGGSSTQTQKAPLPMTKTKRKKAKGLFS
uniref:Uncharacterized protein n=1 Tax=Sphaerodactylus townsendi TaxID=933632 RepID=A0ACB8G1E1_9SAUR